MKIIEINSRITKVIKTKTKKEKTCWNKKQLKKTNPFENNENHANLTNQWKKNEKNENYINSIREFKKS